MWEEGCCIGLSSSVLESFVCFCLVGVLVLGSGEGVVGLCRRCMCGLQDNSPRDNSPADNSPKNLIFFRSRTIRGRIVRRRIVRGRIARSRVRCRGLDSSEITK